MKLPNWLNAIIDGAGLIITLVVDLVIIPICMWAIAPNVASKVAFVCIGIAIVLFVFRSCAKGQWPLWIIFVAIVFFFDESFVLMETQTRTITDVISSDPEIVKIDTDIAEANKLITKLQDERTVSTREATIASISNDIKTANETIKELKNDRKLRKKQLSRNNGATADDVFYAIPTAWNSNRRIPVVAFGALFAALQLVVLSSFVSGKKKINKEPEKIVETVEVVKEVPVEIVKEVIKEVERENPTFSEDNADVESLNSWLQQWRTKAEREHKNQSVATIDQIERILVGRKAYIDSVQGKKLSPS